MTETGIEPGGRWPELPWHDWADTLATLHLWTQVVGKVKLACVGKPERPWQVALAVTERGLTTSPLTHEDRLFAIDLDLVDHGLRLSDSVGESFEMDLEPMTVAHFYRQVMARLADFGIEISIRTRPFEVAHPIPFDEDEVHHDYDPRHVTAFHGALRRAEAAVEDFQSGFTGQAGPVVFYWGSFDVAASRFSGATESACGWWPLDRRLGPAFYAYTAPAPAGFSQAEVRPAAARFDETLGEFVLPYDAVRTAAQPELEVRAFLESTWLAGTAAVSD